MSVKGIAFVSVKPGQEDAFVAAARAWRRGAIGKARDWCATCWAPITPIMSATPGILCGEQLRHPPRFC